MATFARSARSGLRHLCDLPESGGKDATEQRPGPLRQANPTGAKSLKIMLGDAVLGSGLEGLWYLPVAFLAGAVFGLCRALLELGSRVANEARQLHDARQNLQCQQHAIEGLQTQAPPSAQRFGTDANAITPHDPYETAIALARRGVDAAGINAACGIGIAQSRLLIRIHGREHEAGRPSRPR